MVGIRVGVAIGIRHHVRIVFRRTSTVAGAPKVMADIRTSAQDFICVVLSHDRAYGSRIAFAKALRDVIFVDLLALLFAAVRMLSDQPSLGFHRASFVVLGCADRAADIARHL